MGLGSGLGPCALPSDHPSQVVEQMDPEAGIEDEYKLKNDKAYCWKVRA